MLEVGRSKIKVPSQLASSESPLPGLQMTVLVSPYMAKSREIERAVLLSLFIRALIPFMRPHPHDLINSQRSHLLMPSHWRVRIGEFWRNTNIQSISGTKLLNMVRFCNC